MNPYRVLARKRAGESLSVGEIRAVVAGAVDGSWTEAQLAAFLMAGAIRGFDREETRELTLAMLESGESWELKNEFPTLGDKHSTGGVGDKVSLVLSPLLAVCDQPVVMLTGRALGHTGGTADKLESIEGVRLDLDRAACLRLLGELGMAIGIATPGISPADRVLYGLRDATATVDSLPLITASILSKKLATGAAALVFDVKTGNGAFMPEVDSARELARSMVAIANDLGCRASALLTDMSQPLGNWVGHHSEVRETLDCLAGEGPEDLMEVTLSLGAEVCRLSGSGAGRPELAEVVASGRARERFERWVAAQGGRAGALDPAALPLAPCEVVLEAGVGGVLAAVDNRQLGLLLGEAGAAAGPGGEIDPGVALRYTARLGRPLAAGEEIARLYLRRRDEELERRFRRCFEVAEAGAPPLLVGERIAPEAAD